MKKPRKAFLLALFLAVPAFSGDSLGSITGFVKFPGETPPRNMFANPSDKECPHGIAQNHLLVKQETRGLANAIVILQRDDRRVMPSRLQATLSTVGCELLPRVQWVPLGLSVLLTNKDGAYHHLEATQGGNTLFDVKIPSGSSPVRRPLVVPGLFKVNCRKHPWERAWLYVSEHDSVAISAADGRFVIKNVMPGRYKISARHEGWDIDSLNKGSRLEFIPVEDYRQVTVRKNEAAEVLFDTLSPSISFEPMN